jgi:hypothetical protein
LLAVPALLFPLAYVPLPIAASPWYNTFRSIDRIELFSALIAPVAGYATYMRTDSPYREYKGYRTTSSSPSMRVLKPLAFPLCVLFISINFAGPLIRPLDKDTVFEDVWAEGDVFIRTITPTSGPAALISAMHSVNHFADSEKNTAKGTYTDNIGTEFWYLARYAANRGYKTKFYKAPDIEELPIPSVILHGDAIAGSKTFLDNIRSGTGRARSCEYIALLGRSGNGTLTVGDPAEGKMVMSQADFISRYGELGLALAIMKPRLKY